MSIIEQIKAEIERQIKSQTQYFNSMGGPTNFDIATLGWVLEKISTIESEHLADARKTSPKDLKEAAEHYASVTDPEAHGIDFIREVFIAGADWQNEQMMKEAMEGKVKDFRFIREINYANAKIEFDSIPELKECDKVRVLILPKENSHE